MRHLMNPLDFSTEEIEQLMDLADDMRQHPDEVCGFLSWQKTGHLFLRAKHSYSFKF